jgi:hypothetical protein
VDSRLPNGGGYILPGFVDFDCTGPFASCASSDARPIASLTPMNQFRMVSDLGAKQVERWNGLDVSVRTRAKNGVHLQAGASTGRRYTNECEVWRPLPEVQGLNRPFSNCEVSEPFRTAFNGMAAYTLPRFASLPRGLTRVFEDVLLAATFQSIPGIEMSANYNMTNLEFQRACPSDSADTSCSTLGRFVSNAGGQNDTRNVSILRPASRYDDRHNQVDARIGKVIGLGRTRTSLHLDVFNLFNANPVLGRNNTLGQSGTPGSYEAAGEPQADGSYNSLWVPTNVLLPRVWKISARFDF